MNFDIKEIMEEFSKENAIFQNEQQFQFELAMKIQEKCINSNEKVMLEVVSMREREPDTQKFGKRYFSDIIIKTPDGKFCVIELKYKTKESTYQRKDYGEMELVNQGAADLTRFDYLWDIHRIELLKNKKENEYWYNKELKEFIKGYAVLLTNESSYWDKSKDSFKPKSKIPSYYKMCIGQGDTIDHNDPIEFISEENNALGKPFISRNNRHLKLESNYSFEWAPYSSFKGKSEFKYLITEI